MGEDPIAFADLSGFLDEGQVILAEIARAADAQAGSRTTQHDLIRPGLAGSLHAGESVALVEFKDLLDDTRIIHVIVKHDVVSTITLEEPPVLWDADCHRIDA